MVEPVDTLRSVRVPIADRLGVDEPLDRVDLDPQRLAAEPYCFQLSVGDVAADGAGRDGERLGGVAEGDEPAGDGRSYDELLGSVATTCRSPLLPKAQIRS